MQIKKVEFIKTVMDPERMADLPRRPQVALVGRSNVGKSSLLNALCMRQMARISSKPGKTRGINLFLINDSFYLVDLPGYGFANVSKTEQERWGGMMERYLNANEDLVHLLLLLDIRRDPNDDDRQMAYWLEHYRVGYTLVATKADKIAKSKRKPLVATLSDKLGMTFRTEPVCFSVTEKIGREELLARLGKSLEEILPN